MSTEYESPMIGHKEDGGLVIVQFKWEAAKNPRSSEDEGRPIFDNVLRVYITTPGNKNQVTTHEIERHFWVPEGEEPKVRVNAELKRRFRIPLEAWQSDNAAELAGTPLRELPGMDAAIIATLKDVGIHTVEALGGLSDTNMFMGARKWRELAKAYLDEAQGKAPLSKLAAENDDLKARIAELEARLDEPKNRGGRPKKAEAA